MRKVSRGRLAVFVLIVIAAGIASFVLPRLTTTDVGQAQAPLSSAAAALHKEAIVVDGHTHLTTAVFHMGFDPWVAQTHGAFDLARAKQGGLDVMIEQIYVEDAYNNYNYSVKQALRLISLFYEILEKNSDKIELALNSADVRRIVASGKMAAILALEGMPDIEGDLDVVRMFHRLGVRLIQFTTHDSTNTLVDALDDKHVWGGISEQGRAMVREMNRLGILIDVAHSTEPAAYQIIAASQAPVANSHTTLRRFSNTPLGGARPMTDELFKALIAKGGVMGKSQTPLSKTYEEYRRTHRGTPTAGPDESGVFLTRGRRDALGLPNKGIRPPEDHGEYIAALDAELNDRWVRPASDRAGYQFGTPWRELQQKDIDAGVPLPTVDDWAENTAYEVSVGGENHVGIGLDLLARSSMPGFDASQYGRFTEAMLAKGLSPATIKKVLGENWLRVLDQAKVPGIPLPARKAK